MVTTRACLSFFHLINNNIFAQALCTSELSTLSTLRRLFRWTTKRDLTWICNCLVVSSFNPFEKYSRQNVNLRRVGVKNKIFETTLLHFVSAQHASKASVPPPPAVKYLKPPPIVVIFYQGHFRLKLVGLKVFGILGPSKSTNFITHLGGAWTTCLKDVLNNGRTSAGANTKNTWNHLVKSHNHGKSTI